MPFLSTTASTGPAATPVSQLISQHLYHGQRDSLKPRLISFLLSLLIFQGFLALTSSQLLTLLTENRVLLLIHPLLTLWFSQRYDQVASRSLTSSGTLLPLGLGMCCFSLESSSLMYQNSSAPHLILGACSEDAFFGEASSDRVPG